MPELLLSPGGHRYGFRPSLPDATRKRFKATSPVPLPPAVDLTPYLGPVKDQGPLGACTAFAATGYYEYLYRRFKNRAVTFSPLFLYYQERKVDGDLGQGDTGSFGSTAVEVLNKVGCCLENTCPYDPSKFQDAPTDVQLAEAAQYRNSPGAYHSIGSVADMKACLASFYPVLYGFAVYENFEDSSAWGPGFVMPTPAGSQLGGHENFFKGYDDALPCPNGTEGAFSSRNSWSASWGLKGDFWMPYSVVESVLSEARMTHFGKPW